MTRILYTMILFGVVFSLSACGRRDVYNVGQFDSYVKRFEKAGTENGHPVMVTDLVVKFGKMETPQEQGACELSDTAPPTISLREDSWKIMPDDMREQLLFHEMGHCVLMKHHNPAMDNTGTPVSIMNPYIIRESTYSDRRAIYLHDLFN